MAFLAEQAQDSLSGVAEVVGNDGVEIALEQFAAEHSDLRLQKVSSNQWQGDHITLVQGDFFELENMGKFEAIFDRAALGAIEPYMREAYVQLTGRLLQPKGRILLEVMEISGSLASGPPYSLSVEQVRTLYKGEDWVESVTLLDDDKGSPSSARQLRQRVKTHLFLIQAR